MVKWRIFGLYFFSLIILSTLNNQLYDHFNVCVATLRPWTPWGIFIRQISDTARCKQAASQSEKSLQQISSLFTAIVPVILVSHLHQICKFLKQITVDDRFPLQTETQLGSGQGQVSYSLRVTLEQQRKEILTLTL